MAVPVEVEEQTETECPEAWCHSHVRAHSGATLPHFSWHVHYTYTHLHRTSCVQIHRQKKTPKNIGWSDDQLVSNHLQVDLS